MLNFFYRFYFLVNNVLTLSMKRTMFASKAVVLVLNLKLISYK